MVQTLLVEGQGKFTDTSHLSVPSYTSSPQDDTISYISKEYLCILLKDIHQCASVLLRVAHLFIADFRSRKLPHNGQGQGDSQTTGRWRNPGIGRPPLSRAASRRIGWCARLSKRTTRRSACT